MHTQKTASRCHETDVCRAKSTPARALLWTTVAFFADFAGVSVFAPIVPKLGQSMGLSPMQIGLLAACPSLTGALLRIPFGVAVDRMGGKWLILILLLLTSVGVAGVAGVFAFFPHPAADQYSLFLSFGALSGCGIATFSVGVPAISYWYPQRNQGLVLALYAGLGNLAPGIFALVLPVAVFTLGLGPTYSIWLGALLTLVCLLALFMKDAPYFQYRQMGLPTDGDILLAACGEELVPTGNAVESLQKATRDRRAWVLTFLYFVSFGGFVALTIWFPTYWTGRFHSTLWAAGALTALYSLSASLLRVAGGLCSDRFGGERTAVVSFLVVGAGSLLMVAADDSTARAVAGAMTLALGMGFANAGVFKLIPTYIPDAVGGAAGLVGGLGALGGFLIPLALSLLVETLGGAGYPAGFGLFLGLSAACIGLLGVLRKWSGEDKARST
jgi:NNP family nitrate/nitrite transporter-like MFS transporter